MLQAFTNLMSLGALPSAAAIGAGIVATGLFELKASAKTGR